MRLQVGFLLALAIGVASAKDAPLLLESKWKANERVLAKLVTKDYVVDSGKAELLNTRTVEYEEKAIEVKNGLPTRATRAFKRFEAQRVFDDTPQKYALEGKTVEFRSVEGVLQCKEANTSENVLDPMSAGADWAWLLPGKKVAVGNSWKIKTGMHLSTVHWALARGEAKCELAEVKDGVAVLRFGNGAGLTGEARFDLAAGRVVKASIEFSMSKAGTNSRQNLTFEAEILKGDG